MAYMDEEVGRLKECLKEIIDAHYLADIHELKKKITVGLSRERELQSKLEIYENKLKQLSKCHDCHRLIRKFKNASSQTDETPPLPPIYDVRKMKTSPKGAASTETATMVATLENSSTTSAGVITRDITVQTAMDGEEDPEIITID